MVLLKKLGGIALTLWAVLTVVFFMVRLAPGGPFDSDKAISLETRAQLERAYGLDRPLYEQYFSYLGRTLRGDWGVSVAFEGVPVANLIAEGFPLSLGVGLWALLLAIGIGLPLGFYWAHTGRKDFRWVFIFGMLPSFVGAPLLQQVVLYMGGEVYGYHGVASLFWPAVTLGLYYMPFIARLTQVGFEAEATALYFRLGRAKGLTRLGAALTHTYKPALSPLLAYLGPTAAGLITGSFVVETVWGIPGLGRFFVNSVFNRDDTLLLGLTTFYTVILVGFSSAIELLLAAWNPSAQKSRQGKASA